MDNVVYLYKGGSNMKREISIFDVANTFLNYESMTNKKLQKLCYYAQGWHYALIGNVLFDEEFQAWIHGPVCPVLYDKYKSHGWQNIQKSECPEIIKDNDVVSDFLKNIYRIYGDLDGNDLEALTHMERPWQLARDGFEPWQASTNPIDLEIMRTFYLEEFEKSQND